MSSRVYCKNGLLFHVYFANHKQVVNKCTKAKLACAHAAMYIVTRFLLPCKLQLRINLVKSKIDKML